MHSFLLIGQSNMAGRGYLHEAHEIDTNRIYTLRNGRWHPMFRPINPDRSFSGVNLAESFAQQYVQTFNEDVGLICCADGGTSLDQWQPGGVLFDHAVFQAKLAQRTSTIVGILWHQGEADCSEPLYTTYQPRFEKMLQALRRELNLPDVPVLLGGLGEFLQYNPSELLNTNYGKLNAVLQTIVKDNPMTAYVPAEGIPANPDNLHFSADGLYAFGLRYFDVFAQMYRTSNVDAPDSDLTRSAMELL